MERGELMILVHTTVEVSPVLFSSFKEKLQKRLGRKMHMKLFLYLEKMPSKETSRTWPTSLTKIQLARYLSYNPIITDYSRY